MSSTTSEEKAQKENVNTNVDSEHFLTEDETTAKMGCGLLGRNPVLTVMIFAALGIGIGVGLSFWEPDDIETKDKFLQWIGLIGDLFIRALKCVVLPLVSLKRNSHLDPLESKPNLLYLDAVHRSLSM